jgi:hypothetical protein
MTITTNDILETIGFYTSLIGLTVGTCYIGYKVIKSHLERTPLMQIINTGAQALIPKAAPSTTTRTLHMRENSGSDANDLLAGMRDIPVDLFNDIIANRNQARTAAARVPSDFLHLQAQEELPPEFLAMLAEDTAQLPPVIQPLLDAASFIQHSFSGNTALAEKSKRRLHRISCFFGIDSYVPVRGDGNCFLNATAAGLLNYIEGSPGKIQKIINTLAAYKESPHPYLEGFNKNRDFDLVMNQLRTNPSPRNALDDVFTSAFARVLRYTISQATVEGDVSLQDGDYIDMNAIYALNSVFDINAKIAVLEGNGHADPAEPSFFCILQGKIENAEGTIIDTTTRYPERRDHEADFLIVRKSGHFFCGIRSR